MTGHAEVAGHGGGQPLFVKAVLYRYTRRLITRSLSQRLIARPRRLATARYCERNLVERFLNKRMHYAQLPYATINSPKNVFLAGVQVASAIILIN